MIKRTKTTTEGESVVVERGNSGNLMPVVVAIAIVGLAAGALFMMNNTGNQSIQQSVNERRQSDRQQQQKQQFDTHDNSRREA